MGEYINKKVGMNENDKGSLKNLVNEKFKKIDNKNGITRDDKEILQAGRLVVNDLIKEIKNDKSMVYGKWALEPLYDLIGKKNGKGEYTSGLIFESNKLKGYKPITNNKDKINKVANLIDNAENEVLIRLAKNRTTQNSRNIVNKGNEAHKDRPMFVMEGGNDYKKQTGNIIFTKESNPVKIHEALKGLFSNPDIVYEIDYSGCDTSTPKGKAIKEKMTKLIGAQTCYLRYDKNQKTYTIRDKDGNGISDRAYIWEGVKLIPAGVRARQAYVKEKNENENLGQETVLNSDRLGNLTLEMLKDMPSVEKDLKKGKYSAKEIVQLCQKTEIRLNTLLKKAKSLGYELEQECVTKKHFGYGHMELHLNSGSSEVNRTIWGNDGSYNKDLGERLDNLVDSNEGEYKTYLTKRVQQKRLDFDKLTKTEISDVEKKGGGMGWENLNETERKQKEKEAQEHKAKVLYGIGLFEKMVDNYKENEGDSRLDNDDKDLVQIKKLIRNAKASIDNSNNLDDNAIINNFINPIWEKRASIKKISKKINNGQGQNPAYKEQYNQLKIVFLGDKNKQISAIRTLGGHGRLFDNTETSFLAEEIEGNDDLTVKNADIKECINNIKTRLPDSIFDKNGNIIQKRKEQFDKMFTAATKGTDSLISLLVNSKMLPANRKDEESEVRNCVENLKNQLNAIDKQSEIPNITASIKQKEKAEKLKLEQKSNKTEEEIQRLQALTFLENHPEQRDTINQEIIERTRLELRYLSLGDTVKSCLFPALAELGGGAEGKNSDIYNDIKGYGTWNLSDENAKKWSEEIIEDIIIEVAITAISIALAPTGAGEAIYLSFRIAKASAKGLKGLNKLRKSMGIFSKSLGKKMATQYASKFSVKSAKAAKKITKVSHIATSTEKGIKGLNIVKRTKDAYQTIKATETFGSLAGKLAMKGGSMVIEGVGFHLNSTVIHNAIEGKNLSEGINPFGYTEGPNGEKISNFRNYAQSIAFLGVLKTIGKPIQGLTGNMAKGIFGKYYDANWLTKMAKNIVSMTGEMGSMMGTDQILSLTFDQKFKPVTAEDLVSMFGMVAGLRLTNKVYLKIQEYDGKSVTVEMKQGDNTFNVKIDREGNVIKVEGKDKDGNKIQNPQEALGIKSGVEGQNLRETHNGKEVGTVKGNLRQLNNLHEGDIITVKHGENNVRFKKNKDGNREVIDAGNIENDRFKPGEEYIAKENQDGSGYHLETKAQGGPKISLDGKVGVKLRSSELETEKKSQESEEKSEDEIKKTGEELEDIKERASKIRTKIKEIEKQISEIENSREISNRKTLAHNIYERRTGKKSSISINKYYEGKILKSGIQIIDTRTGKKTTIKFDAQKKINDLGGNTQELAKLDIEIAERMILGIKNGHIEVEDITEAVKIKNGYKNKNLEIIGLENGNYGVRKKSNIRKLRDQKTELEGQLKGLKSEQRKKTAELNKEKKSNIEENTKKPEESETKKPEEKKTEEPKKKININEIKDIDIADITKYINIDADGNINFKPEYITIGTTRRNSTVEIEGQKYRIFENGKGNGIGCMLGKGEYKGEILIGNFKNGKLEGKGIIISKGAKAEGNFKNGKLEGKGVYTRAVGDRYEGDFVNGEPEGKGVYTRANGSRYEGDFVNGEFEGKGVHTNGKGGRYEGDFVNGKFEGKGIKTRTNGTRYEGDFVNGEPEGKGIKTRPNGTRYEGNFINGEPGGKGKVYNKNNQLVYEGEVRCITGLGVKRDGIGKYYENGNLIYEGEFKNGMKSGKGKEYDANGNIVYEGEFRNGTKNGKGIEYDVNGNKIYEGDFVNDKFEGKGKVYKNNKLVYEGNVKNGKYDGYGKEFDENGNVIHDGYFGNGKYKEQQRRQQEQQRRQREEEQRNGNERPDRGINTERREMAEVHRNSDVIAIGDLHGEYVALKGNMEYAGLASEVNGHLERTGGNKKVVFQGDILGDRGTDGLRIIKEIHQLREQARKQGGDVDIIVGNHDDFMISYLLGLKGERFLGHRVLDVIDYKQRKGLNELAKFIGKDIRDSENLYGTGTREAILQAMRNSQEGRLILEEICNMKLVSQVDDVLYCHTNPTAKMLEYLTKGNVQQNINLLNQKYQGYLRKTLLGEGNGSITLEEFNQISDTFLNTNNRPKYGSEIGLENYTEALKNNGINMISHGHNGGREYHTKQIGGIKIVDTDYSYGHSGNYTGEHSVSVIKKEGGVNYIGDYANIEYPIGNEVYVKLEKGGEQKARIESYNPKTKEYTVTLDGNNDVGIILKAEKLRNVMDTEFVLDKGNQIRRYKTELPTEKHNPTHIKETETVLNELITESDKPKLHQKGFKKEYPDEQCENDVQRFIERAQEKEIAHKQIFLDIGKEANAQALFIGPPKKADRIVDKVKNEYLADGEGGLENITDFTRSTLLFDNYSEFVKGIEVLKQMQKEGRIAKLRIKNRINLKGCNDMLINIETADGYVSEVQFHISETLILKDGFLGPQVEKLYKGKFNIEFDKYIFTEKIYDLKSDSEYQNKKNKYEKIIEIINNKKNKEFKLPEQGKEIHGHDIYDIKRILEKRQNDPDLIGELDPDDVISLNKTLENISNSLADEARSRYRNRTI